MNANITARAQPRLGCIGLGYIGAKDYEYNNDIYSGDIELLSHIHTYTDHMHVSVREVPASSKHEGG